MQKTSIVSKATNLPAAAALPIFPLIKIDVGQKQPPHRICHRSKDTLQLSHFRRYFYK